MKNYSGIKVEVKNEDLNKSNVVYKLTFPNGKVYIGQTIHKLSRRLSNHCNKAINNILLSSKAINKYKTFSVEVLYQGDDLDTQEIYWISYFNSNEIGYNLEYGGCLNKIVSEETRKKISEANKGKIRSEETKEKLRISNKDLNKGKDNPAARPIIITEIATGIEMRFDYVKQAAEYFNVLSTSICNHLNGRSKTFNKKQYKARYE